MTINFLVSIVAWVAMFVVVLFFTVPDVPVAPLMIASVVVLVVVPLVVLPAVQDHLGGDRVPGGPERTRVPHARPTGPSNEGPGVAKDQVIVQVRSTVTDWLPAASTA